MGIVLSNNTIFSDSSYTSPSNQYFKAGTLLTVLSETKLEHEDNGQKQLFKWYKVKSNNGKTGWIFGESLLIKEKENFIPQALKSYCYRKFSFNSGFEKSMVWFGSVIGRDNFGSKMMSNVYEESYLIITNDKGRSVYIPITSSSQFGESTVETFAIQELTGDQTQDFVLQTNIKDLEKNAQQKLVQLYTFQAGTLQKIFEEPLNIAANNSNLKHLIFQKERIQGYYFNHDKKDPVLFSFTYFWNKRTRQFELLYPASPSIIRAVPNSYGVSLKNSPNAYASSIKTLNKASQLQILKVFNQSYQERGRTYQKLCAEVQTENGQKGFVPFNFLQLLDFNNKDWIQANLQPGYKSDIGIACIELPTIPMDTTSIQN